MCDECIYYISSQKSVNTVCNSNNTFWLTFLGTSQDSATTKSEIDDFNASDDTGMYIGAIVTWATGPWDGLFFCPAPNNRLE